MAPVAERKGGSRQLCERGKELQRLQSGLDADIHYGDAFGRTAPSTGGREKLNLLSQTAACGEFTRGGETVPAGEAKQRRSLAGSKVWQVEAVSRTDSGDGQDLRRTAQI
jgi:hypothetical protein